MFHILFSSDKKQALRMFRHLAGMLASLAFTLVNIYFFYHGLFFVDATTFFYVIIFFWIGIFLFTILIRTGLNKKAEDPSLTIYQILWGTSFLLTIIYLLDMERSLMLMPFFGVLSFGYFKLRFREFLSIALFAILGYSLIVLFIFLSDSRTISIEFELMQLITFIGTVLVMLYTGSSITQLREKTKKQYAALEESLELNKKLATTDELTNLYNRRYFMKKLSRQKSLSERDASDFVICYFDLDHFKLINDTFGHHIGDIVLQKFAEILLASIREIDFAARFGGEEFVCLLVNTDIDKAVKVTERIRHSLATYNFNDISPSLRATVSIGVSNFKQFNTIQETLTSADRRMYHAKKSGRNKVVATDEES